MRLFILFLFALLAQLASAQSQAVDRLYILLREHPKKDTIKVTLLNELSVRILKSQPEKSFDYATQAQILAEHLKFEKGIGEAKNNLAVYHLLRGNADMSIDLALEAVKIGEQRHYKELLANGYATLGTVYHNQLAYDKAIHYLLLAQDLNSTIGNTLIASKVWNALGGIARDKRKYDSALFYYDKALAAMKAGGDNYRLPEVLNNIGIVYMRQQKKDLALSYYSKSLTASEEDNNIRAQALALGNIGQALLSEKKYKEAEAVLLKSLTLSKNIGDRKILSAAYMALGQLKNETGKFEDAHRYLSAFFELKDSLINVEKANKIAELEIRYETEKKELAIQLLERDRSMQMIKTNIIIAILVLLIIVSVVAYYFQQYRERKNRMILNLEIDQLTLQHKELSERYKEVLAGAQEEPVDSGDQRLLKRAIDVVERNMRDSLFGVEQMAKELAMSRTNLHRKLKAITGFPPSELIRNIRLRKAAALLLNKADSVSQISLTVGFEDHSYFSKSFKKQFGVTPSEYLQSREHLHTKQFHFNDVPAKVSLN